MPAVSISMRLSSDARPSAMISAPITESMVVSPSARSSQLELAFVTSCTRDAAYSTISCSLNDAIASDTLAV